MTTRARPSYAPSCGVLKAPVAHPAIGGAPELTMAHYQSYPVLFAHHELGAGSLVAQAVGDLAAALEARGLTVTAARHRGGRRACLPRRPVRSRSSWLLMRSSRGSGVRDARRHCHGEPVRLAYSGSTSNSSLEVAATKSTLDSTSVFG